MKRVFVVDIYMILGAIRVGEFCAIVGYLRHKWVNFVIFIETLYA